MDTLPNTIKIALAITFTILISSSLTYYLNKKNLPTIVKFRMQASKNTLQIVAPNVYKAGKFTLVIGKFSNVFIHPVALKFTEMLKIERLTGNSGVIVSCKGDDSALYRKLFKGLGDAEIGKFTIFEAETGKIGYGSKKSAKESGFDGSVFICENGDVVSGSLQVASYLGL